MPAVRRLVERGAKGRELSGGRLLIASGATDIQVCRQMGHSKVETTKNIYGHLFAQDQASILNAMNQAVTRLYVEDDQGDESDDQAA